VNHRTRRAFRKRGEDVESIVIAIGQIWFSLKKSCGGTSAFLWRQDNCLLGPARTCLNGANRRPATVNGFWYRPTDLGENTATYSDYDVSLRIVLDALPATGPQGQAVGDARDVK
jgi:hypothetical protein